MNSIKKIKQMDKQTLLYFEYKSKLKRVPALTLFTQVLVDGMYEMFKVTVLTPSLRRF